MTQITFTRGLLSLLTHLVLTHLAPAQEPIKGKREADALLERQALIAFQESLIENEITGSNVAMIVEKGKVVYQNICNSGKKGDMDIGAGTIFPIWSMSKPITIVAMMTLYEKGLVKWEDPVSKYIPCFGKLQVKNGDRIEPCKNTLTLMHLMTHRSGYKYYGRPFLLDQGDGLGGASFDKPQPNQIKYNNLEDFVRDAAAQPLEFEPGTRYLYGINQAILGRVIEVVSGQAFYDYLKHSIFDPLGMSNTKFHLTDEELKKFQVLFINSGNLKGFTHLMDPVITYAEGNGAHFGGEGLVSTLGDYARFCEMLVNGGFFRGRRIISQASIDTMTQPWSKPYPAEPAAFPELKGYDYGFSLFVLDDPQADNPQVPKGIFGWSGYHNTHFWIDPANSMFGLFMTNAREYSWDIPLDMRKAVYGSPEG